MHEMPTIIFSQWRALTAAGAIRTRINGQARTKATGIERGKRVVASKGGPVTPSADERVCAAAERSGQACGSLWGLSATGCSHRVCL